MSGAKQSIWGKRGVHGRLQNETWGHRLGHLKKHHLNPLPQSKKKKANLGVGTLKLRAKRGGTLKHGGKKSPADRPRGAQLCRGGKSNCQQGERA